MRKHAYPIECLLLVIFEIETMVTLNAIQKIYFWIAVALISIFSYVVEGARPYTPIFFLIAITNYLEYEVVQMLLIALLALLIVFIKFYEIEIVGKGPYNAGFKSYKHQDIQLSIFYPSMSDGQNPKWIPSQKYKQTLYDIFYVDPFTPRLPYRFFTYVLSFLFKIRMPVLGDAQLYRDDYDKNQKWSIILFSHGLGSNVNNYSALCGWWASHGYIVVSIQHDNDLVRIDFPKRLLKQIDTLRNILFNSRNSDIIIRAQEMEMIYHEVTKEKLLDKVFTQEKSLKIQEIYFAGHSFGAGTSLETLSNIISKNKERSLIKGVICMDPWMFPVSPQTYKNVRNENVLVINTDTFLGVQPAAYHAYDRLNDIKQANSETMKAFMITKTDHLAVTDFVFAFGSIFSLMKIVKLQKYAKPILELHQIIISMFLEGRTTTQILKVCDDFGQNTELGKIGVQVKQQWRYSSKNQ